MVVTEVIREENNGTISFGDHSLVSKTKKDGFVYDGDILKVKTFNEITKLEKNGMLVYESVPGTSVEQMEITDEGMTFAVFGHGDVQITLGLEENALYEVTVDGESTGEVITKMGGKLFVSVELSVDTPVKIEVKKIG